MIDKFKEIEKQFLELDEEEKKSFILLVNSFFEDIQKKKSLSSLKSTFIKSENKTSFPPPPPPITNISSPPPPPPLNVINNIDNTGFNPLKTRNISTGPLTFNKPLSQVSLSNKKNYLTILDALDYISPFITDIGREALNPKRMIETDIYKFLKLISENQTTLKEVYIMEFANKYTLGKYLQKIYEMSKEKYFINRKNKSLNNNDEVNVRIGDLLLELNFINKEQLDFAIKIQKGEEDFPKEEKNNNPNIGFNLAQQVMQKINTNNIPKPKILLGNVLVELKYITKEQLDHILGLQRWLKYSLEITK